MNRPDGDAGQSGFLLMDKPAGMSSFKSLSHIKRYFPGLKAGYAGTLDPDATGLMVVGIGHATRLLSFFENMAKEYIFHIIPGIETDTYDTTGTVLARKDAGSVTKEQVEDALNGFIGEIEQMPPVYSALKIRGKRACDRVRAGEQVEVKSRRVSIYSMDLLDWSPEDWTFKVVCSKGAYVRSLAHDLGALLECGGAASGIRRAAIGNFRVETAVPWDAQDRFGELLSIEAAVEHLPAVRVGPGGIDALTRGMPLGTHHYALEEPSVSVSKETVFRIRNDREQLLALGEIDDARRLLPRKMLSSTSRK